MQSYVQVLGNHNALLPPSFLLSNIHGKLIIDVPENIQRLSTEHRLRISKVEDILITRLHPDAVAGLPGLLLTIEGLDAPNVDATSKKRRKVCTEPIPTLDVNVSFKQTIVGRQWMSVTHPTDGHTIWFRPILERDKEEVDLKKFSESTEAAWQRAQELRHTIRGIRLWGPPGIRHFLQSFMDLCGRLMRLNLEIHECTPGAITRYQPHTHTLFNFDLSVLCLHPEEGQPATKRPRSAGSTPERRNQSSIPCIFGRGDRMIGKFLIEKARALGVPQGPLYGQLKGGSSVTLPDGRLIEPLDVCEPSEDAIAFVILNCQKQWELDSLRHELTPEEARSVEESFTTSVPTDVKHLKVFLEAAPEVYIIDTSSSELRVSSSYRSFLTSLRAMKFLPGDEGGDERWHYVPVQLSPLQAPSVCYPFVASQALNLLVKETSPHCHHVPSSWSNEPTSPIEKEPSKIQANFLDRILLVPRKKWRQDGQGPKLSIALQERVAKLRSRADSSSEGSCHSIKTWEEGANHTFPMLMLLGTGAAQPSKYRNVSSSILRLDEKTSLLLDCGEGTSTQLFWSANSYEEGLRLIDTIETIFISHKHADHHNGLLKLLHLRHSRGLHTTIIAPAEMRAWIHTMTIDFITFKSCEDYINEDKFLVRGEAYSIWLKTIEVLHLTRRSGDTLIPNGSFGARIILSPHEASQRQIVISFSGDLASDELWIDFVKGTDCLLHEATFEDELEEEAIRRNHCTTGDAINVALKAQVPLLVLTHFSQRYPSIPNVSLQDDDRDTLITVAFGMDFTVIHLHLLADMDDESRKKRLRALNDQFASIKTLLEQVNSVLAATEAENATEDAI